MWLNQWRAEVGLKLLGMSMWEELQRGHGDGLASHTMLKDTEVFCPKQNVPILAWSSGKLHHWERVATVGALAIFLSFIFFFY